MKKTGFTLIETLVAISIIALATAGPLYSASRALVATQIARDQLISNYVAQESIEHIRMLRDNEYLKVYKDTPPPGDTTSHVAWNNFITSSPVANCTSSQCTIDPLSNAFLACGGGLGVCQPLYIDSTGLYRQYVTPPSDASISNFTRTVQFTAISPTDELVTSRVTWSEHGTPYVVTVTDNLTQWQ